MRGIILIDYNGVKVRQYCYIHVEKADPVNCTRQAKKINNKRMK